MGESTGWYTYRTPKTQSFFSSFPIFFQSLHSRVLSDSYSSSCSRSYLDLKVVEVRRQRIADAPYLVKHPGSILGYGSILVFLEKTSGINSMNINKFHPNDSEKSLDLTKNDIKTDNFSLKTGSYWL